MLEMIRAESAADGKVLDEDDLQVKLLADLQQQQKKEAQRLLNDLEDKVGSISNLNKIGGRGEYWSQQTVNRSSK